MSQTRFEFPSRLRRALRSLHRDAGYLAVGLTFVYAVSGIAVNHIADWDPNFTQVRETYPLPDSTPKEIVPEDQRAVQALGSRIKESLGLPHATQDVYAPSPTEIDLTLSGGTLHVNLRTRVAEFEGQKSRFLVRAANYLHTNRGKQAWTWIADGYAAILLYLATSGLLLLPMKRGLLDRKLWLVLAGAGLPILYVTLSPLT